MKYDTSRVKASAEGKKRAFLKRLESDPGLPEEWRCPRCGKYKPLDEFGLRTVRLKSGVDRVYPRSTCKPCDRRKTAARKERLLREDPERWREERRRSSARNNRNRRKSPAERGERERRIVLNAEPFLRYIEPLQELLSDNERRRIRAARQVGRIDYDAADRLLTRLGEPHAMRSLYGDID